MLKIALVCLLAINGCLAASSVCDEKPSNFCIDFITAAKCKKLDVCLNTEWKNLISVKNTSEVCEFCQQVIVKVRENIASADVEKQVQDYLKAACNILSGDQQKQCNEIANNYLPEFFQTLRSYLDSKQICTLIGLCESNVQKIKDEKMIEIVQPSLRLKSLTNKSKISPIAHLVANTNDKICDDCKKIISDIDALLNDPETKSRVEKYISINICNILGDLASACNDAVKQYLPMIIDLIESSAEPTDVCAAIGLCTNGDHTLLFKMHLKTSPLYQNAIKLMGTKECGTCKTVLTDVKNILTNPVTQSLIETALEEGLCSELPGFEVVCKATVKTFGHTLFNFIASEVDPESICKGIGFCVNQKLNVKQAIRDNTPLKSKLVVKVKEGSGECILCEYAIEKIDGMITENSTEEEIVDVVERICDILPGTIEDECKNFIDMYGEALVKLLVAQISPKLICTTLGLCTPKKLLSRPLKFVPSKNFKIMTNDLCPICETLMQYIDSQIDKDSSKEEIENIVGKVCTVLPSSFVPECHTVIDQYGPKIIDLLVNKMAPRQVCTEIGLCSSLNIVKREVKKSTPLLGADKCTQGPNHWCAKKENAVKCDATVYCERVGWKVDVIGKE